MKKFLLLLALAAPLCLRAQNSHGGIPDDVYYLMPSFGHGYILFMGQQPAQGLLNICALDNSLRFMDGEGNELQATNSENIVKVIIDTVSFMHYDEVFYRMFPVTPDMGVARRRDVRIITKKKEVGYGGTSETASVRQISSVYTDGVHIDLSPDKQYPYEVEEVLYFYKGSGVYDLTKRNLRKLFPAKKAEIDAWFKAGNPLPKTLDDTRALLEMWSK